MIEYSDFFYPVNDDVFQCINERRVLFVLMGQIIPVGYTIVCVWRIKSNLLAK